MKAPKLPACRAWGFLSMAFFLLIFFIDGVVAGSHRNGSLEWQILTKRNFSSQIRLHPNVLLFVSVPWSGEARSLMKEIAYLANREERVGPLKLMVIHRNTEKMLADVLGATGQITILCYHHSVSYKYQGRLRAQNILSSVYHLMSHQPEDLPIQTLDTAEDLEEFFSSTDKAVLLLEFCGWGTKLLRKGTNGSENAFVVQDVPDDGVVFGSIFDGETNAALLSSGRKYQKGLENEKLTCEAENGLGGIPWLGGFTLANDTTPLEYDVGLCCTFEEFRRFQNFLSNFTTVAREFFLPPERQRFGMVSERSLLSFLGIGNSDPWLVMIHFSGCPNCSKIIKQGEDLRSALRMHHPLVIELEGEGHNLEPALPANRLSVILFVDRSSESVNTRRESVEAINALRELMLRNQFTNCMDGENNVNPLKSSAQASQYAPATKIVKLKDNMAAMVIKEGHSVALNNIVADEQIKSINDVLAYLLQKKEAKLSSLAKEVGFQLLSDDIEVKVAGLLPSQTETSQSYQIASEQPRREIIRSSVNMDTELLNAAVTTAVENKQQDVIADVKPSHPYNEEMFGTEEAIPSKYDQIIRDDEQSIANDSQTEDKSSMGIEKLGKNVVHHQDLKVCFFFSDGGYQLLRSLTAGSKIPSMVVMDPISQQHYVIPDETAFSYYSLVDFLYGFLNGSVPPYQHSESLDKVEREATHPPFVNLVFHEVDAIPRVTADTFPEMVLGSNLSDTENVHHAWEKDVLVLFSNSWCGFCQRMELVVREVYRSLKGYMNMLKSGSMRRHCVFINDNVKHVDELPLIYLMDCTLNDCGSLLKSFGQFHVCRNKQREIYPALMLFPAGVKNAVPYQGDTTVTNIIKFIAEHGSHSHNISNRILWTGAENGGRKMDPSKNSPTPTHAMTPVSKAEYHEVLLNDRIAGEISNGNKMGLEPLHDLHETIPHVVVGSILAATDKLLNAPPFDKSLILIVKVDREIGFQGLIINKHIKWDTFQELDKGLELLKKAPLSFGGPLMMKGMPLVSLAQKVTNSEYPEVRPSVYFLDQLATVQEIEHLKLGNQSISDYWFFLGYSSWGWEQLFNEIAQGAWHIGDDNYREQLDWPKVDN
ncbi:PREDICTED: uncharacterized protein LOC104611774 isoform X2 [Nelumbo nucifera]|uniref:Uncharacterized protein LOC104611774 isoform X2 n=1 Tax=Nelumbo nucifera TaxID=4432 RepID=A0A1U8BJJ9_NELNU|nr:PREDICTED: uncharacterized protein LOC104611774 isoform X2 [Nelumbo nucifera]